MASNGGVRVLQQWWLQAVQRRCCCCPYGVAVTVATTRGFVKATARSQARLTCAPSGQSVASWRRWVHVSSSLAAAGPGSTSSTSPTPTDESDKHEAYLKKALRDHDVERARSLFLSASARGTHYSTAAYGALVTALASAGDQATALVALRQLLSAPTLDRRHLYSHGGSAVTQDAYLSIIDHALGERDTESALLVFDMYLASDMPLHSDLLSALVEVLASENRVDEAIRILRHAPTDVTLRNNITIVELLAMHVMRGDHERLRDGLQALNLDRRRISRTQYRRLLHACASIQSEQLRTKCFDVLRQAMRTAQVWPDEAWYEVALKVLGETKNLHRINVILREMKAIGAEVADKHQWRVYQQLLTYDTPAAALDFMTSMFDRGVPIGGEVPMENPHYRMLLDLVTVFVNRVPWAAGAATAWRAAHVHKQLQRSGVASGLWVVSSLLLARRPAAATEVVYEIAVNQSSGSNRGLQPMYARPYEVCMLFFLNARLFQGVAHQYEQFVASGLDPSDTMHKIMLFACLRAERYEYASWALDNVVSPLPQSVSLLVHHMVQEQGDGAAESSSRN